MIRDYFYQMPFDPQWAARIPESFARGLEYNRQRGVKYFGNPFQQYPEARPAIARFVEPERFQPSSTAPAGARQHSDWTEDGEPAARGQSAAPASYSYERFPEDAGYKHPAFAGGKLNYPPPSQIGDETRQDGPSYMMPNGNLVDPLTGAPFYDPTKLGPQRNMKAPGYRGRDNDSNELIPGSNPLLSYDPQSSDPFDMYGAFQGSIPEKPRQYSPEEQKLIRDMSDDLGGQRVPQRQGGNIGYIGNAGPADGTPMAGGAGIDSLYSGLYGVTAPNLMSIPAFSNRSQWANPAGSYYYGEG